MNRIKLTLTAFLFLLVLCGCEFDTAKALPKEITAEAWQAAVQDNGQSRGSHTGTLIADEKAAEKETEAKEKLLTEASGAFWGHCPVDESFLNWFSEEFGSKTLVAIAEEADLKTNAIWYEKTKKSIFVLYEDYRVAMGFPLSKRVTRVEGDGALTLGFAGDVGFIEDTAMLKRINEKSYAACFSDELLAKMRGVDRMMINNEFCYTTRGTPIEGKDYHFRCPPRYVNEIKAVGVDYVSLANNHVYDYDEEGFLDTLSALEQAAIPYIGAGRNLSDASEPLYFIKDGRKVAVVSATQIERSATFTKEATEDSGGVLKTLQPERFCGVIGDAKKHADLVVVIVHWGTEGDEHYGSDQVSLAKSYVRAGADVVIGGHTHCLQGIEYISDVPVFYSLGNFWFYENSEMPEPYDTAILELTVTPEGRFTADYEPCRFSNGRIEICEGEEKERILRHIETLSETAQVSPDGRVTEK